ncbi:MAG: substrate-binding domain-containing protein [Lachnospiraceae bacterium]|nr:substrate-binding domain-containing protein [Lachnospiraceae bacterium]
MIGKHGKLLIFLYIVFLIILFLMCSTDLIIREPEREIYQIAVIIEDVRSDNYSNFRKGMDQAAMEFNVDVRFITLYEKLDVEQQMELMDREQQDGADALIVVPADEEQINGKQMTIPVIFLRSGLGGASMGSIIVDYENMGEQLAGKISEDIKENSTVLLLTNPAKQSDMDRMFINGAETALSADGYSIQTIKINDEDGILASLDILEVWKNRNAVILAENQEILTAMAGVMADDPEAAAHVRGLYGRGNTMPILNYMDRGYIDGICVTDDFSIGYLSVREAVQALEGYDSSYIVMDSYYIEKEELREPVYEKVLFPIE